MGQKGALSDINIVNEDISSKTDQDVLQVKLKVTRPPSKLRRKGSVTDYIILWQTDTPRLGDFSCNFTAHDSHCLFNVLDLQTAIDICEDLKDSCKGFAWMTMKNENGLHSVYMKNSAKEIEENEFTSFYVKRTSIKEISWKKNREDPR